MYTAFRSLFATASVLAAFGAAGAAHASTPVTLNTAGLYDPGVVNVSGVANGGEYASAVEFGATVGASPTVKTLYGFCVDLTHVIYVGFDTQAGHDIVSAHGDAQSTFNYAYHTGILSRDSVGGPSGTSGAFLSATQIGEIGGLANYGIGLINAANPNAPGFNGQHLSDELAAVQGAIWSIEYPARTFSAPGAVGGLMSQYVAAAPGWATRGPVQTLYADNGANQGFVIGSPAPEPASWALMIGGFGLAGAALRRRASRALAAAI